MKKVLFATSALVLSAGFAVAEVAVSGDGRMGMIYDGDDVQFASRARVLFTLTGESDAGLSFGGNFRVDQENWSNERSAAKGTRGEVWISGTYGKLSMGDVMSASEAAIGDLYEIGYTNGEVAGDLEEVPYLTLDGNNRDQGPGLLYQYSVDNLSFYASATDGVDTTVFDVTTGDNAADDANELSDKVAYSLAAKYDGGNWNAGLGYAKHGDANEISLGAEGKFDNFSVKGVYARYDDNYVIVEDIGRNNRPTFARVGSRDAADAEMKYYAGISAAYQADAILVKGFLSQSKYDVIDTNDSGKVRAIGIGADYDLGGGAVLAGGITHVKFDYGSASDLNDSETVADLGVKFKF